MPDASDFRRLKSCEPDLDARVWFVLTCLFSICMLCIESPLAVGVLWAILLVLYRCFGVSLALLGRCIAILGIMYVLIVVSAALVFDGTGDVALSDCVGLSLAGLARGCLTCVRLMAMVALSLLLTQACVMSELMDGLTALLRPLGRVGLPVGDIAIMLGLALRCIPLACEKLATLSMAQNARGARIGLSHNPIAKVLSYVPLMVPLCVAMFRYADEFAFALGVKRFTGRGRTELHVRRMGRGDWLVLVCGSVLAVGLAVAF